MEKIMLQKCEFFDDILQRSKNWEIECIPVPVTKVIKKKKSETRMSASRYEKYPNK